MASPNSSAACATMLAGIDSRPRVSPDGYPMPWVMDGAGVVDNIGLPKGDAQALASTIDDYFVGGMIGQLELKPKTPLTGDQAKVVTRRLQSLAQAWAPRMAAARLCMTAEGAK